MKQFAYVCLFIRASLARLCICIYPWTCSTVTKARDKEQARVLRTFVAADAILYWVTFGWCIL